MRVNSISNNAFGARIMPSEYLNKAIDLAKSDVAGGTKEGQKRAARFFNNLVAIESDNSRKLLTINDSNKKLPPILNLDGTKFFVETYKDAEDKTALAVQEAINTMAESKYFQGEVKDEASKMSLNHAFDYWKKY